MSPGGAECSRVWASNEARPVVTLRRSAAAWAAATLAAHRFSAHPYEIDGAEPGGQVCGDANGDRRLAILGDADDGDHSGSDFLFAVVDDAAQVLGGNAVQCPRDQLDVADRADRRSAAIRCAATECQQPLGVGQLSLQAFSLLDEAGNTIDDLVRLDRQRKGKKLANADWASKTDPDAKVARMKNGSTRLAYKPEHAVDLDTGVIVAAPIHPADKGDTTTLDPTLEAAARNLTDLGLAPTSGDPCDLVTDKGYHSRAILKRHDGDVWKTRIAEPAPPNGYLRWHGDEAAQKAVYANRSRLKSAVGRKAMRKRGEMVERSFAHVLDRGGMRRAWLRGRENVHKRYLIHVAGFNLGILMRALFGCGTPKGPRGASKAFLFVVQTDVALVIALIAELDGERAMLLIVFAPEGA